MDDGLVFLEFVYRIQGTNSRGRQWNKLLDTVVTILKYKISIIDHSIYINVFSGGNVYYLTLHTDVVLDNNNNETAFPEPINVFQEALVKKIKE